MSVHIYTYIYAYNHTGIPLGMPATYTHTYLYADSCIQDTHKVSQTDIHSCLPTNNYI